MRSIYLVLVTLFACTAMDEMATGQQPVPLSVDDAINIAIPRPPMQFSPDGQRLAYAVQSRNDSALEDESAYFRSGVPWWGTGSDIYIVNVATGETTNITGGSGNNWLPAWSPDGKQLAFLSDRDGGGQAHLWLWNLEKKELRVGSKLPVRMQGRDELQWTRDGTSVLVAVLPLDLTLADYWKVVLPAAACSHKPMTTCEATVQLYRSDEIELAPESPSPRTERLSFHENLRDLVLLDLATGMVHSVTRGNMVAAFHLLPKDRGIAYARPQQFEETGSQRAIYDLVVWHSDLQDKVAARGINLDLAGEFSFSPDGLELSYGAPGSVQGELDIYTVAVNGGASRNLTQFRTAAEGPRSFIPLWDAESANIYFIRAGRLWRASLGENQATEIVHIPGARIEDILGRSSNLIWNNSNDRSAVVLGRDETTWRQVFYKVDLQTGIASPLLESWECYTCVGGDEGRFATTSESGKLIAFFAEDAQHPLQIWKIDAGFTTRSCLTRLNPQIDKIQLGSVRIVSWLSDQGQPLHGALILPSAYEQGKRYPLIVMVYPSALLSKNFGEFGGTSFMNLQLFATRGYAVLLADSPQQVGTPLADVASTVLPGVNKVVELGIGDPDRLGIMGHSNGGYGTLALIVTTKRFKAAIEADGYGDLPSLYGEMRSDGLAFGNTLERSVDPLGGTPWEYRDRYIENSPMFYLDRVDTPLLIAHGAEDAVVAPFLGDQLFVALRRLGKAVEYAKYGGEGHVLVRKVNLRDFANRAISWFDHYLKSTTP